MTPRLVTVNGRYQTSVVEVGTLSAEVAAGTYGVYQLFAEDGTLLYVGRTRQLPQRLRIHASTQQWWPLVKYGQWTPVANYGEAVALERSAIETDGALFNAVGSAQLRAGTSLPDDAATELLDRYAESDTLEGAAATDSYMLALREAGWTLAAIGLPLGITRERVRQRVAKAKRDESIQVPRYVKPKPKSTRKVWPTLTDDERAELRRLRELGSRCRGRTAKDAPERLASERFSELCAEYTLRGVRRKEIAEAAGVTTAAITMRLKVHGYHPTAPSQHKYGTGGYSTSDECRKGHPFTGDNVRYINGDRKRRVCRTCDRERVRRYQERRATRGGAAS